MTCSEGNSRRRCSLQFDDAGSFNSSVFIRVTAQWKSVGLKTRRLVFILIESASAPLGFISVLVFEKKNKFLPSDTTSSPAEETHTNTLLLLSRFLDMEELTENGLQFFGSCCVQLVHYLCPIARPFPSAALVSLWTCTLFGT